MAEVLKVAKAMFRKTNDWDRIPDSEKEECFFIFNRYFSKKYIEKSQLLNDKLIDKLYGMNLWFNFMKDQPYPNWFWSKSEKTKDTSGLSDKEISQLLFNLSIKKEELDLLIAYYPDLIKEELIYYKNIEKGNK